MITIQMKIKAYLELVRPHNVVASLVGVLVGYVAVTKEINAGILIPLIPVAMVSAAGYVINDYFDFKSDLVNKPWRPIPSGRVSLKESLYLSLALYIMGVTISIYLGIIMFFFTLGNALLIYFYSKSLKETGLLGNIVVSLGGANTIIYGGLAAELANQVFGKEIFFLTPAAFAFTLLLLREIIKGIEDFYGDEVRKVKTLARTVGYRNASLIAIILALLLLFLTVIAYVTLNYSHLFMLFALTTLLISFIATVNVYKSRNLSEAIKKAAKARGFLKIAIFLGLLAFLLNSLL